MKITVKDVKKVNSNQNFENKINFTVGNKLSKMIHMLRDGVYSHKVQTMVQEYLSNARDSHRSAKTSEKIKVYLPTKSSPTLIIKDYGLGMNLEELKKFSSYLESTKDNDDSQTGGFGIGGKIAFAYTDSFVLISRKNGEKYTVVANKVEDPDGTMNIVGPEKTDEVNGVDVMIPILEEDFEEVERSVVRLQLFWKDLIEVSNDEITNQTYSKINEKIVMEDDSYNFYLFKKENKHYSSNDKEKDSSLKIDSLKKYLVGNTSGNYPFFITIDDIPYILSDKIYKNILEKVNKNSFIYKLLDNNELKNSALVFKFKTSELIITTSRESITDKPVNIEAIANKINSVSIKFEKDFFKIIEKDLTPDKAIKFIKDVSNSVDSSSYFFVKKFFNIEEIFINELNNFYLKRQVETYRLSTRTRDCNLSTNNLLLEVNEKEKYSWSIDLTSRKLNYFSRKESPSISTLKSNLRRNTREYIGRDVRIFQKINKEDLSLLKRMGLIKDNYHEFADKNVKPKAVNDNEISARKISFNKDGGYTEESVSLSIDQINKEGFCVSNNFFKKNIFSEEDEKLLYDNKVSVFILGEKTLEKLGKKINTIGSCDKFLKKISNDMLISNIAKMLDNNHQDVAANFGNILFKKNKELEFLFKNNQLKNHILNQQSSYGYNSKKIRLLNAAFLKKNEEIFESLKKGINDFIQKNPIVNVVSFYDLRKDNKDAFEQLLKCIKF